MSSASLLLRPNAHPDNVDSVSADQWVRRYTGNLQSAFQFFREAFGRSVEFRQTAF
jgi:hypothetical protein